MTTSETYLQTDSVQLLFEMFDLSKPELPLDSEIPAVYFERITFMYDLGPQSSGIRASLI